MRWIGGVLAPLLLGGCLASPPAGAPAPADAAGLSAAELRASCKGESECYSEGLVALLQREGVEPAMATLERLAEADSAVRRDGHMYVHAIGLAAYSSPETVGATFRQCTAAFQSGCYHGVIQAYFADLTRSGNGVTAATVNALCADYRNRPSERWLLFQCAHGAGHGLTMFYGYHLPRALAGCDLLEDWWEREGCYGGAMMENIVQATTPHHAVGRPDAGSAASGADQHAHHGAHAQHAMPSGEFKSLDPQDPLYPCSVLEERYLSACYQMQTSAVLFHNGGDVAATARVCDAVPAAYRSTCYVSLGRDISALTLQNHAAALRLCASSAPGFASLCHVGYVKNLIDLTADAGEALAFCRQLPDGLGKEGCYRAIGEQVWVLTDDRTRQEQFCAAAAESGHQNACRMGAGLPVRAAAPPFPVSGR